MNLMGVTSLLNWSGGLCAWYDRDSRGCAPPANPCIRISLLGINPVIPLPFSHRLTAPDVGNQLLCRRQPVQQKIRIQDIARVSTVKRQYHQTHSEDNRRSSVPHLQSGNDVITNDSHPPGLHLLDIREADLKWPLA